MASISFPVDDNEFSLLNRYSWVNWSESAREKLNKRRIFEEYIKTRKLSPKDEEFCEAMDWHPVDELALKEEFVRDLRKQRKSKGKSMSKEEFARWSGQL